MLLAVTLMLLCECEMAKSNSTHVQRQIFTSECPGLTLKRWGMYFEIKHDNSSGYNCRAQSIDGVDTEIPRHVSNQQLLVQLYVMSFPLWYQAAALVSFFQSRRAYN